MTVNSKTVFRDDAALSHYHLVHPKLIGMCSIISDKGLDYDLDHAQWLSTDCFHGTDEQTTLKPM